MLPEQTGSGWWWSPPLQSWGSYTAAARWLLTQGRWRKPTESLENENMIMTRFLAIAHAISLTIVRIEGLSTKESTQSQSNVFWQFSCIYQKLIRGWKYSFFFGKFLLHPSKFYCVGCCMDVACQLKTCRVQISNIVSNIWNWIFMISSFSWGYSFASSRKKTWDWQKQHHIYTLNWFDRLLYFLLTSVKLPKLYGILMKLNLDPAMLNVTRRHIGIQGN